ncbi:hypothetical protein ACFP7A_00460 [Sporolactobacillus kofuensis]|uniref:Polymer-forming cytoskeletal protein n=2 Tax=Sporolactobacillus kofuensis TaxID=269672 RepID=A0ABW1WD86_9BACL
MSVSFNHSTQFSKETYKTQATNAAEMGLKAYNDQLNQWYSTIDVHNPPSFATLKNQIWAINVPDRTLNLQGNPEYKISKVQVDSSSNQYVIRIQSLGIVHGEERTISMEKKFVYDENYQMTEEHEGLSLPYMNGAVIVEPGQWQIQGAGNKDTIHIIDQNKNPTEPTYQSVDLTEMKDRFENMRMAQPSDSSNSVTSADVSGNVYVSSGQIDWSKNRTFEGDVYINGDVEISGDVTFKGNVHINGSLAATGIVNVAGNLYVENDLTYGFGQRYQGYVFVGGDFLKESSNGGNPRDDLDVHFDRTVYVNGSFEPRNDGNKSELFFSQGVIVKSASLQTSANGDIYFYPQRSDSNASVNPLKPPMNGKIVYE